MQEKYGTLVDTSSFLTNIGKNKGDVVFGKEMTIIIDKSVKEYENIFQTCNRAQIQDNYFDWSTTIMNYIFLSFLGALFYEDMR